LVINYLFIKPEILIHSTFSDESGKLNSASYKSSYEGVGHEMGWQGSLVLKWPAFSNRKN